MNAENEDSAFIQSVKASEQDRVRVLSTAAIEVSDRWIL